MERFIGLGVGIMAPVPVCFWDNREMVLYCSWPTVDLDLLRAAANKRCLLGGDLIGATHAIRKARRDSDALRREHRHVVEEGGGARVHGPPRKSLPDCLFSFAGAFLAILALMRLFRFPSLDLDQGWYGSTLCIVFVLTLTPVGQPRQIACANLRNALVLLVCRRIPAAGGASGATGRGDRARALAVASGIGGQAPSSGLSMRRPPGCPSRSRRAPGRRGGRSRP